MKSRAVVYLALVLCCMEKGNFAPLPSTDEVPLDIPSWPVLRKMTNTDHMVSSFSTDSVVACFSHAFCFGANDTLYVGTVDNCCNVLGISYRIIEDSADGVCSSCPSTS